ncbi:MAG TPA: phenylalanine--tRNA ligase subunit alpha [Candidatus Saccharimonadales bacterium]|nr:phenylalanine--tRNA ligase subunit alpha [Candidatus Saccharimonadales bacterium]
MNYQNPRVAETAELLRKRLEGLKTAAEKTSVLRSAELRALFDELKTLPPEERGAFGKEVNALRGELQQLIDQSKDAAEALPPIDITAPFDVNVSAADRPGLLNSAQGSRHPLMTELEIILDIFYRMGFTAVESREIDDDFHMFGSLNFPEGHPARDEYDTFLTTQKDQNGKPYVAPAHTSIMQNRILRAHGDELKQGKAIAAVIPGRVFRNEDLDARHEHTFYQLEGIYVDKGIHAGNLLATFKTFLSEYFQQNIDVRSQPFYFPFTEPSFELSLSCPFCQKKGCNVCSQTGWIELLGMGMIHPNVLQQGGVDPAEYTGFAWGCGIDRLVMMKYGIEDVRHFESGKLDFLRQFA